MAKRGVLDPLIVKEQVVKSATKAATAILRIDDYITVAPAKSSTKSEGQEGEASPEMMG